MRNKKAIWMYFKSILRKTMEELFRKDANEKKVEQKWKQ